MTLRYNAVPEDMGAFTDWHFQNTPETAVAVRHYITRCCLLILFLCGMAAWLLPQGTTYFLWEAVIGVAAVCAIAPTRVRQNHVRQVVKTYSSGANAVFFGRRVAEITPDGIMTVSDAAITLHKWVALTRVANAGSHAYFVFGEIAGLVIARGRVTEGNFDAFVAEAERLHAESKRVPLAAR